MHISPFRFDCRHADTLKVKTEACGPSVHVQGTMQNGAGAGRKGDGAAPAPDATDGGSSASQPGHPSESHQVQDGATMNVAGYVAFGGAANAAQAGLVQATNLVPGSFMQGGHAVGIVPAGAHNLGSYGWVDASSVGSYGVVDRYGPATYLAPWPQWCNP